METIECRPNIEELYASAITAGNLKIDTRDGASVGPADVLMAASWSPSLLGKAMIRLHSEWDSAEKPAKPTKAFIEALAATHPPSELKVKGKKDPRLAVAQTAANKWHLSEMFNLVGKLKTLPYVRYAVIQKAVRWHIADPEKVVPEIIKYWLDQNCRGCGGLKRRLTPGLSALSGRQCLVCQASGLGAVPYGEDGKRLCNYIDDCVMWANQSIKKSLRDLK